MKNVLVILSILAVHVSAFALPQAERLSGDQIAAMKKNPAVIAIMQQSAKEVSADLKSCSIKVIESGGDQQSGAIKIWFDCAGSRTIIDGNVYGKTFQISTVEIHRAG